MDDKSKNGFSEYNELTSSASSTILVDKIYENSLINNNGDENGLSEIRAKEAIKKYKEHRKVHRKYINQRIKVLRRCIAKKYLFWTDFYQTRHPSQSGAVLAEKGLEERV